MKIQSSDVAGDGTVIEDKSITTESGNPWGAFITAARATIGGDPSDIVLDAAVLTLLPSSTNVTELGEVFDGSVTLEFEMNSSKTLFTVADGIVSGSELGTEFALGTGFDFDLLTTGDVTDLLGGSFKVVLTAPTEAGFVGLDADADLEVVLTFSAFE